MRGQKPSGERKISKDHDVLNSEKNVGHTDSAYRQGANAMGSNAPAVEDKQIAARENIMVNFQFCNVLLL